ncbi:MAG TPA: hypothetical protein VE130_00570 [Nitrososphaeraceae archaeon]|nr:hypothetical protein [Nitrososphaeraceae archaeon]
MPERKSSPTFSEAAFNLCNQILELDVKIRFVGIADHLGALLASAYRNGLVPLLTREETTHYALQSVLRASIKEDFESKLGRQEYSIGKYENVIRATIPIIRIEKGELERNGVIEDRNEGNDSDLKFYLLLSFDVNYNAQNAIESKILPFLSKNNLDFLF